MKTNILTAILTVFFVIGLNFQITNTTTVNNAIVESNKKVNVVIDTNAPTGKDYNKVDLPIRGSRNSHKWSNRRWFGRVTLY